MAHHINTITAFNHHNSTTNNLILDYLFYQSIQSRLCKSSKENDTDKNVIESVIEGILASRKNTSDKVDGKFEQRLNLCQLTNLAFGRTHHVTFSAPVAATSKRRRDDDYQDTNHLFSKPLNFCRRHRQSNCTQSQCAVKGGPGLAEAIPAFLKTSANMLRSVLDSVDNDNVRPLTVAGQQVMGGGMPPRWYDLFLDLLTQAAIQSYMCDGKTGLETIYEIFSYGYVEDEDEEDTDMDDDEDDEEEDEDIWNVKAADHHLLFPKTRTMFLFKLQVRQREKQFIHVKNGYSLSQHFLELEKLYPLAYFERNMSDFIQMLLEDMDIPALDKCDMPEIASPIKSPEDLPEAFMPSLYKYPGDGSLLMPEILDEVDDIIPLSKKRSAYTAFDDNEENHRKHVHH